MSTLRYYSSGRSAWSHQKKPLDPTSRMARFGKIQPMEKPSLFERLFGQD